MNKYNKFFRNIVLGAFLLSVFTAGILRSDKFAFAIENVAFRLITGTTQQNTVNTGITDFEYNVMDDDNDGITNHLEEGFIYPSAKINLSPVVDINPSLPGDTYTGNSYSLEGWVWNRNIGWISLNCEDFESVIPAPNPSVCSQSNYRVYMTEPVNPGDPGYLRGYAWSPKVGWLLFHFGDDVNGNMRGGYENGVPKVVEVDLDMPNPGNEEAQIHGYAWNKSLGYFSLEGAKYSLIDAGGNDPEPLCENPKVVLLNPDPDLDTDGLIKMNGYDMARCPKNLNDPVIDYSRYAIIKCDPGTTVSSPVTWTRKNPNGNQSLVWDPVLGDFTIDAGQGRINWRANYSTCNKPDDNNDGVEDGSDDPTDSNREVRVIVEGDNGFEVDRKPKEWDVKFCPRVSASDGDYIAYTNDQGHILNPGVDKDDNVDPDPPEGTPTHKEAFIDNKYSVTVSLPNNKKDKNRPDKEFNLIDGPKLFGNFRKNPNKPSRPKPRGMEIRQVNVGEAQIVWPNPNKDQKPDGEYSGCYDTTLYCTGKKITTCIDIDVKEKPPISLSSCPATAIVGQPYECTIELDANHAVRASLPLTYSISSNFNLNPADPENPQIVLEEFVPAKPYFRKIKINNQAGGAWNPKSANDEDTFTFTVTVDNAADGSLNQTYTVKITNMAIPPKIAPLDPALDKFYTYDGDDYVVKFNLAPDDLSGQTATEPLTWSTQALDQSNNQVSMNPAELSIDDSGLLTYKPPINRDGQVLKIKAIADNSASVPANKNAYCTRYDNNPNCNNNANYWKDEQVINQVIAGFKPVINETAVEREFDKKFAVGQLTTLKLDDLTRECTNVCGYTNDTAPVSGTPKIDLPPPTEGFRWKLFPQPTENFSFIEDTGEIAWTPNIGHAGEKSFTIKAINDFGESEEVEIDFIVAKPPVINMGESYTCDIGANFIKYATADAEPDVTSWAIEAVTIVANGTPPYGVLTIDGQSRVMENNTIELLTIATGAQDEGIIEWINCQSAGGILKFKISANNGDAKGYKEFTITIPAGPATAPRISDVAPTDYQVHLGQTLTIPFRLDANTGHSAGQNWRAQLIYDNDSDGDTDDDIYIPVGDLKMIPIDTQTNLNGSTFEFKPDILDHTEQNKDASEKFRLNIISTDLNGAPFDTDSLLIAGVSYIPNNVNNHFVPITIKILPEIPPSSGEAWSREIESSIAGAVNVRSELAQTFDPEKITNIGDVSGSTSRDRVYSNVLALTKGVSSAGVGGQVQNSFPTDLIRNVVPGVGKELLGGKVLYFEGDPQSGGNVYIEDNPDIKLGVSSISRMSWKEHYTIIVYGANLFINDDLWPTAGNDGTLDIVVLRKPGQSKSLAGNVLIHRDVTNIKANIFADGGVFSYDAAKLTSFPLSLWLSTDVVDGVPNKPIKWNARGYPEYTVGGATKESGCDVIIPYSKYIDCMADAGKLEHQLKIRGSINSRNTIGGTVYDITVDTFKRSDSKNGYGEMAGSVEEALAFDLKFLRFYHLNYESCGGNNYFDKSDNSCDASPYSDLTGEDQVICSIAPAPTRKVELDSPTGSDNECNDRAEKNEAVIIEYQPYSVLSRVFRQ